jgi:hypothetical protein
MRRILSICVVMTLVSVSWVGEGQSTAPMIYGRVTDSDGAALPGVTVTIRKNCKCKDCTSTNCDCCPATATVTVTDANGNFRVPADAGTYEVEAAIEGFATKRVSVAVAGQSASVTIALDTADSGIE